MQLNERRKNLYDAEMKPKCLASDEFTFVETHMGTITNFIRQVQQLADNCQHTFSSIEHGGTRPVSIRWLYWPSK